MTSERPGANGGLRRRDFLRRSATVGATAVAAPAVLASCTGEIGRKRTDAENPFDVAGSAALEVVVYKGVYGDVYAGAHQDIYRRKFPGAKIEHVAVKDVEAKLETRFVGGSPPDVVDDSGDGRMNLRSLVDQGQAHELADLLGAPSMDIAGKTVKETLLPGALAPATFDSRVYAIPYVVTAWGLWYDAKAFRDNGWDYPRTWDDLLALCEEIQGAEKAAPFVWPGRSPAHLRYPLHAMAFRTSGEDVWRAVDNLEPDAWRDDAIEQALGAWYDLAQKGYALAGSSGFSRTDAEARWLQGKAALLPSGSWLEAATADDVPEGFEMTLAPMPSVTGSDKVPFDALTVLSGEPYLVPADAKNVAGGMEYLRVMCSAEGAQRFAETARSMTLVAGAHDEQDLSPAFASTRDAVAKALKLPLVPNPRYPEWYAALADTVDATLAALMTTKIDPAEAVDRIQRKADEVSDDTKITKRRR